MLVLLLLSLSWHTNGAADRAPAADPLYLQFHPIPTTSPNRPAYNALVGAGKLAIVGRATDRQSTTLLQAAEELRQALRTLLGRNISVSCCDAAAATNAKVLVNVTSTRLTPEAFVLSPTNGVLASRPSGALYGVYRLLALMQQDAPLPRAGNLVSAPATNLRVWDLWDNLDGGIERGFGGPK